MRNSQSTEGFNPQTILQIHMPIIRQNEELKSVLEIPESFMQEMVFELDLKDCLDFYKQR